MPTGGGAGPQRRGPAAADPAWRLPDPVPSGCGVRVGRRGLSTGGGGTDGGDALAGGCAGGFILRIQVLPTLQQLYDFGGGVMVARPSVPGRSVSAAPWCRGGDALPGISGGTKVVRLVILGFLEAVMGW